MMSTPNDPQDPYSAPDGQGSGDQSGSVPPYPGGSSSGDSGQGGIPQYGQYSGSDAPGGAGQPPAYPGYGQPQGGYGQPGGYGQQGGYAGPPPQNYLVFAILTTVLCCLPLGIVSIVFSSQVNSKWNAGDQAGAVESARKAKLWAIWSAVIGFVGIAIYAILLIVGVASTDFDTYQY
jgi:hypothetical protein